MYGEGEWKVRLYGKSKRRTWRKLHLAIDAPSQEIVACCTTTHDFSDGQRLPDLLSAIAEPIDSLKAEGAYDHRSCSTPLAKRGIKALIPPGKSARIWQHGNCQAPPLDSDQNLPAIRTLGRTRWKQESGYHQGSLAETGVYRLKTLFRGLSPQDPLCRIVCARVCLRGKPRNCLWVVPPSTECPG